MKLSCGSTRKKKYKTKKKKVFHSNNEPENLSEFLT